MKQDKHRLRLFKDLVSELDGYYIYNPKKGLISLIDKDGNIDYTNWWDDVIAYSANIGECMREISVVHTKMWKLLNVGGPIDLTNPELLRKLDEKEESFLKHRLYRNKVYGDVRIGVLPSAYDGVIRVLGE